MSDRLTEDVTKFQGRFAALKAEVGKVLVGQDDMLHRLPAIDKVGAAIGWRPERTLDEILADVIAHVRAEQALDRSPA